MSRVIDIDRSRVRNFFHFQRDPLGFLVETADKGDVVSLRTGTFQSTYVVNSPEFIRALLVTHESRLVKGRSSNVLRRTIGDGLLTSEHNQHRQQRKYMQPAFYKERINSYARTVVEEAGKFADGLQNGSVIDVHEEMMQLTLSIITKTMFHASVDEDKQRLSDAVDTTIAQTAGTLFSPLILPLGFPTRGNRNHKHAISELETMIYNTLNRAKQQELPDDSLLGMLIETKDDDGNPISDEEIRDQMMTMLLAGHETTASLLTWVFYLLSDHPEAREKVLAEVKQCHKPYSFETFMQLSYTKQVIEETLRLYPPAWIILRESRQSIDILGETFTDKSSFLISPYAIHRNPAVFQDPYSFKPERFSPGRSYEPYTYFPFGGGPRGCIGSRFAMMEAVLILAVLIEKAEFRHKEKEIIPEPLVSLRVKGGLKVSVELNG